MSHFTVLSGFLGGAATTEVGKNEKKVEQRVIRDSDRFIINKFLSTPMTGTLKSFFRRKKLLWEPLTVLDATIVKMITARVLRSKNGNLNHN